MTTLIKQFIEAERSGNWDLLITTIQQMLPFFHAAGHFFCARCAHLYMQDMMNLKNRIDPIEYEKFTNNGYFTIRRMDKFWSGIWSNQTIEQTLMKTMKNSGGLTRGRGITESVLIRWTLGMIHLHNICEEVEKYCNIISVTSEQHVDVRPSRIALDIEDVEKVMQWFSQHIPFPINDVLMSISSGVVGTADVNCHLSHELGCEGISRIVGGNFENVKFKRKDKVITLATVSNSAEIGKEKITVDPLTLFHRICVAKQSDEDLKMFFTFELTPFPLSLFSEEGMRKGTKSSLFSAFTPTKIDAVQRKNNFVVVDGGHLLHKVVWQRNMNFGDTVKSYLIYLQAHYGSNVAVVFDEYPSYVTGKSVKSAERIRRANLHSSHEIIFNKATCPEISQEQFLANETRCVCFIDLLKKFLQKVNVTGKQTVEDTDVLIVETAVSVRSQYDNIFVVGEYIDLLVFLMWLAPMKENLYFQKWGKGRTPDVLYSTTSFKYKFSRMILFIHAFSGCDTTSALFVRGKTKLCSLLEKNPTPGKKCKTSACDLNPLRYTLFTQSATKTRSTLARLHPTVDVARFHALRSYLQIQKWLGHEKNPLEWGWVLTRFGLFPRKMERDAAPESLLKMISCNSRKGARMLVVAGKQVLYVLPWALVLWEKLAKTCQTSIDLRTALKMKTRRHRQ
ncbi:hypothetical protein AVEN_143575-1 [Araneus ventricosus]|uniref:Uncharacterized protein n=1 Tax=Araneus ventricosus TaxID=182803 RepID=A0A4Y2AP10_ARAVE|nr:hypothetical protein AVEN_143575-1 [Araneus ventricosus]